MSAYKNNESLRKSNYSPDLKDRKPRDIKPSNFGRDTLVRSNQEDILGKLSKRYRDQQEQESDFSKYLEPTRATLFSLDVRF